MKQFCKSLGIKCRIQKEAIQILACSFHRMMETEEYRITLIKSLSRNGSAVRIHKVSSAIDALVEQKLLVRYATVKWHGVGLNKEIFDLPPETVDLIQHTTNCITKHILLNSDLRQVTQDVKLLFRKFGYTRKQVKDNAFEILVNRFRVGQT